MNRDGVNSYPLASGEIRFMVTWYDGKQRHRRRGFMTRREAKEWKQTRLVEQRKGAHFSPQKARLPFSDIHAEWSETRTLAHSTNARDNSYAKNYILPHFGDWPVEKIRTIDIEKWIASLNRQGLKPATVKKAFDLLRGPLDFAVKADALIVNPADRVDRKVLSKIRKTKMRLLSLDELESLADEMEPRLRLCVLLMGHCGLRIGECLALRVGDIDLKNKTLHVEGTVEEYDESGSRGSVTRKDVGKTENATREILFSDELQAELRAHIKSIDKNAPLFPNNRRGWISPSNFRSKFFNPAVERADLNPAPTPHDLRHTAISMWIASGMTILEVSQRAGHAKPSITLDIYGHLFANSQKEAQDKFEQWMGSQRDRAV